MLVEASGSQQVPLYHIGLLSVARLQTAHLNSRVGGVGHGANNATREKAAVGKNYRKQTCQHSRQVTATTRVAG